MPHLSQTTFACVPLPAPGGPDEDEPHALLSPSATRMREVRTAAAREPLVVARDEVGLDLVDGVERDADDDHDRRTAPAERDVEPLADDARDDADDGDVERPAEGDAREHVVDVVGRLLALADARDERLLLLQVVGHVDRLERDRRVEVAEEDDEQRRRRC